MCIFEPFTPCSNSSHCIHEYEASDQKEHMPSSITDVDIHQHHAGYDHNFTVGTTNWGSVQLRAIYHSFWSLNCPHMLGILNTTLTVAWVAGTSKPSQTPLKTFVSQKMTRRDENLLSHLPYSPYTMSDTNI